MIPKREAKVRKKQEKNPEKGASFYKVLNATIATTTSMLTLALLFLTLLKK